MRKFPNDCNIIHRQSRTVNTGPLCVEEVAQARVETGEADRGESGRADAQRFSWVAGSAPAKLIPAPLISGRTGVVQS
ncbi:hypothetical protein [Syntrophobacter fumaroxidans]|uniref:hypothetical protein n=1 Tax=Syntrophobacter fumaroxidans TaxID=119484 RepID=UPI001427A953|nr:hypothetical protein [Syntrophobacter fumaroxidans]